MVFKGNHATIIVGWDSILGLVTRLWAGWYRLQIQVGARNFTFV